MRINEILYFAPGVRFVDVDIDEDALVEQFVKRMRGFYLEPAQELAKNGHAFASGVMAVTTIDALALIQTGDMCVNRRFKEWCRSNLRNCGDALAKRFYEEFRNGIVHEGRVKDGSEFNLDAHETLEKIGPILSCNPLLLLEEVAGALDAYADDLGADAAKLESLRNRIRQDFAREMGN